MKQRDPTLLLASSPFLKQKEDIAHIMWQVNMALVPVVLAALYFFGLSALLVIVSASAGAILTEWFFLVHLKKGRNTIKDGSALITGLLLALTLPPGVPLWIAFFGGVIAILLGKLIFGGLGYNIFNPALLGRAFLQAAFPVALTTWSLHKGGFSDFFSIYDGNLALPFLKADIEALSSATPLAKMKFESQISLITDLFYGSTDGSLGETSAFLILLGGLYLTFKKIVNWRIPLAIFSSVLLFGVGLYLFDSARYSNPFFYLFSGGLMLGAIYMATDMVTYPTTHLGAIIFGLGIGFLVMIIRIFGGLAEGMMYAILLMNAATPLLNRVTQPRVFGSGKKISRRNNG